MARGALGSLVVSLGLDAAEYFRGLDKAEYQAKKFGQSLQNNIAIGVVKAEIALRALGEAVSFAMRAFPELIQQAAHFQDLAEKTGASAEELASFSIAAQVAGVSVDDLATFSVKLSKNLTSVDEESSKTAEGLKALGIPIAEFRNLDPAAQIDAMAKALARFNDTGGGKSAALEQIAKGGAQLLPLLKELEASGGRQLTLTAEQIRKADEFADATARSKAQINALAQQAAVAAAGPIAALTGAFKEYIKTLADVDGGMTALAANTKMEEWAERQAKRVGYLIHVVDSLVRLVEIVNAGGIFTKEGQAVVMRPFYTDLLNEQLAQQKRDAAQRAIEDRGFDPRPKLPIGAGGGGGGREAKERISDAERYLETLQKQLEGTQELTAAEKVLLDFSLGRIKGMTQAEFERAHGIAQQIDAVNAQKKAQEELRKAEEADLRIREQLAQTIVRQVEGYQREAASIDQANEAIKEQIEFYKGGEAAVKALTDAKLAKRIADEEELRNVLIGIQNSELQVAAINEVIAALKRQRELLGKLDVAKKMAEEAKALQDVKNMLSDTFADAFTDFITGAKSAKDAFKSFTDDLTRQISRIAAQNIANAIFGGKNSAGPDLFGVLGKLLFMWGGGTSGIAGPVSPDLSGGGLAFAATGTNFARGGATMVGERGPEVVNLPRGAKVTPAGPGLTIVQNINVPTGANSATLRQSAKRAFGLAAVQMRRG